MMKPDPGAVERIREEWGDKPCSHPHTVKERYNGTQTGDIVCLQCGRYFFGKEALEADRASSNKG